MAFRNGMMKLKTQQSVGSGKIYRQSKYYSAGGNGNIVDPHDAPEVSNESDVEYLKN